MIPDAEHSEKPLKIVRNATKQPACVNCVEQAKQIRALRRELRDLAERNERLTRAIQRESHFIDERVMRNK